MLAGFGSLVGKSRRLNARPKFTDYPFKLGVASGDPLDSSVVLWTRIAPKPLEDGGLSEEDIEVRVRVATDEKMGKIVRDERFVATPELAHSVHFIAEGLSPATEYWYQFSIGSEESPVGRTRTIPSPGSKISQVSFAYTSCQHYEQGYYSAYRFMANEELDLVVQLGDYIYEYGSSPLTKKLNVQGGRQIVRQHNSSEVFDLAGYRNRYALYKSDIDLQAAHAAFPWIVSWDDHEVSNNWASDMPQSLEQQTEADFFRRRLAAMQAYYEHMPLRRFPTLVGDGIDRQLRLYSRLPFGDLLQIHLLDTRQYRSDQVCATGDYVSRDCPERHKESHRMIGLQQEKWLQSSLENSNVNWNVLAQQVWFGHFAFGSADHPEFNRDAWDGYPKERRRLLDFLVEHRISNPVVLSGDWHCSLVQDVGRDPTEPQSEKVVTEFAGTSLSSYCARTDPILDNLSLNPQVKFFDGQHRGYVRCQVDSEQWQTDYRFVSTAFDPHGATIYTGASFVVESGRVGANRA